jgi:predicted amidohydrolase YtcJ
MLAALDKASLGRPVLLRDDSLHNRWVNSRALEIMGIGSASRPWSPAAAPIPASRAP